jgi:UDP-GlcNAc:undecaprenyl-phosphate GlcNAc-1-phosphate transferase
MTSYYVIAAIAAAVSLVATPIVRGVVMRLGGLDVPIDRKVHRAPTPTYGGIALYIAFALAILAATGIRSLRGTFRFSDVAGMLAGGFIVMVIGVFDDHRDLSRPARLAGECFAAGILYLSGVQMSFFWLPVVGTISLSPDISAIATILWIVLLTNALNYIDGLDGLAAGLTAIASGALFVYSTRLPAEFLGPFPLTPLVAAALVGACLGFLPYNFNPARIFMGDTGAYPLDASPGRVRPAVASRCRWCSRRSCSSRCRSATSYTSRCIGSRSGSRSWSGSATSTCTTGSSSSDTRTGARSS